MVKGKGKSKAPRAKSAYNFFMSEKRKEVLEANPKLESKEVMKEVAKLWKDITEEEKKKYEDMAKEDKERVSGGKSGGSKKDEEDNEEED